MINHLFKRRDNNRVPKNSIKEAFDNLPSGVCFFNQKGRLILCNKQMFKLCFYLTLRELQLITDLDNALINPPLNSKVLKDKDYYIFPDKSVWRFSHKIIGTDESYHEFVASNVTTLYEKQEALKKSTIERELMGNKMRQISSNIVAITREEEILSMKMLVHNKVGEALQRLRYFKGCGMPLDKKEELVNTYNNLVHLLMGEIGNSDEVDDLLELLRIANTLNVTVKINGNIPTNEVIKDLLVMCLRESLTNTIRHAKGDLLVVDINETSQNTMFNITNNGIIPTTMIIEGGGLSSLRKKIEMAQGIMKIECYNDFKLIVCIPNQRKEVL